LPWLRLEAGLDFEGNRWPIDVTFNRSGPPREGDGGGFGGGGAAERALLTDSYTLLTNHVAPFVGLTLQALHGRLAVTPQLRLDFQSYDSDVATQHTLLEPRLNLRWQLSRRVAVKGAAGLYHEPPQPIDLSAAFGNPRLDPESATHWVLGTEFEATDTLHVEASGFYKDLEDLIVRGEHIGDPALTNQGIRRVYGGELLVRQQMWKNFFGWIAYTISKSERRDHADEPWRVFQFDQTHILTVIGSWRFGRGYQLGGRFRYVTGDPYTPVVGAYYEANQDRYVRILGPTYSARLGAFHQLDVRFDKTWTFDRWKLSLYLDVQNVYNRANPEAIRYNFDYRQSEPQAGLPFLPVAGIRGEL
jgi:hypothetical protein